MNVKEYRRTNLETGISEILKFEESHSEEVGYYRYFDFTKNGLPELIAMRLVNKWNAVQAVCRPPNKIQWSYWII